MRVGLVTNWGDHCSISEYAKNLIDHLPKEVDVKLIGHPLTYENIKAQIQDVDVVHFNYINFWIDHGMMDGIAALVQKKVIITYQEKPEWEVLENSHADLIVLHDVKGDYPGKVRLIPNGIKIVDDLPEWDWNTQLGSAGFAAEHKGFLNVARVGQEFSTGCLLLMCAALDQDFMARSLALQAKDICPSAEIDISWLPYETVVRRMAKCAMTIFPYDMAVSNVMPGIGNAVRFGLASGRPVLVPKGHSHFRDLADYEDEIYLYSGELKDAVRGVTLDIIKKRAKLPKRILEDMSWTRCAQMYTDLYKEVLA